MPQVLGSNAVFVLRTFRIPEDRAWHEAMVTAYGPIIADNYQLVSRVLDVDSVVVKLVIAILMFSPNEFPTDQSDAPWSAQKILKIQNMYVELAWRYMVSKYSEQRAVAHFSNLIRCLFALQSSVQSAWTLPTYQNIFNCLVGYIEEKLNIERYAFE